MKNDSVLLRPFSGVPGADSKVWVLPCSITGKTSVGCKWHRLDGPAYVSLCGAADRYFVNDILIGSAPLSLNETIKFAKAVKEYIKNKNSLQND